LAVQALCQLDVQGTELLEHLQLFFAESDSDASVQKLAAQWTEGAWQNSTECDQFIIAQTSRKWRLSRLSCVDRSILRLAVFQLTQCPDIPAKVIINEAIELAKKFSTDKSPGFVNGVLDAILKILVAEGKR